MKRCISGIIMCLVLAAAGGEAAAVPNTFTFTGRLQNGGSPVDGAVTLGFALYDAGSGGTQLWSETHATTADNGLVTAAIGGQTPLDPADFDGSSLWVEVSVNAQVLAPRYQIRSVPYALRAAVADDADTLGGLAPGDVALSAHTHAYVSAVNQGAGISVTGGTGPTPTVAIATGGVTNTMIASVDAAKLTGTIDNFRYDAYNEMVAANKLKTGSNYISSPCAGYGGVCQTVSFGTTITGPRVVIQPVYSVPTNQFCTMYNRTNTGFGVWCTVATQVDWIALY